jgi:hypothetical protein
MLPLGFEKADYLGCRLLWLNDQLLNFPQVILSSS